MPTPSKVHLHRKANELELHYSGTSFVLTAEYLRVNSPSAEVRGHGKGQEQLQFGKMHVGIKTLEAQGNYAIRIVFDDGHDSGIFSWDYLYELATQQESYWQNYLQRLNAAGLSRDPDISVVRIGL